MKTIKKFLGIKIPLWVLLLTGAILLGTYLKGYMQSNSKNNSQSSSMVQYIEEANEVVFLNVGIEKVVSATNQTTIPWTDIGIPFSEKKSIIILNYAAKLGIRTHVKVEQISEKKYKIIIPKYEVLGIELDKANPYQLYDSSGELLSYSTQDIDTGALVAQTLSNEEQVKYLEKYVDNINDSAMSYYKALFQSISKNIELEFEFSEQAK